jgi:hypothetical protein
MLTNISKQKEDTDSVDDVSESLQNGGQVVDGLDFGWGQGRLEIVAIDKDNDIQFSKLDCHQCLPNLKSEKENKREVGQVPDPPAARRLPISPRTSRLP